MTAAVSWRASASKYRATRSDMALTLHVSQPGGERDGLATARRVERDPQRPDERREHLVVGHEHHERDEPALVEVGAQLRPRPVGHVLGGVELLDGLQDRALTLGPARC